MLRSQIELRMPIGGEPAGTLKVIPVEPQIHRGSQGIALSPQR